MAQTAEITAGFYNADGGLGSGAFARLEDFHPYHQSDESNGPGLDAGNIIDAAAASFGMVEV